jgi:hypothetical protein
MHINKGGRRHTDAVGVLTNRTAWCASWVPC